MNETVEICIPCYEMHGKGSIYLKQLLETIKSQKGVDFSVFVSDQSSDDSVESVCSSYSFVKRVRFTGKRKASSNLNNALVNSTADIIKIMFQDDLFFDDNSLLSCVQPLIDGHKWSLTASCHTDQRRSMIYNPMLPVYHEEIHHGNNTISSPSVVTVRRENMILFDENVSMLLDVDWYKSMRIKNDLPHVNNRINIVNRLHDDSLQVNLVKEDKDVLEKELEYIKEKYGEINV